MELYAKIFLWPKRAGQILFDRAPAFPVFSLLCEALLMKYCRPAGEKGKLDTGGKRALQ